MSDTVGQREYIFSYKSVSLYFGLEMRMLKATFRTSRSDQSFLTNHNYTLRNLTGSADRQFSDGIGIIARWKPSLTVVFFKVFQYKSQHKYCYLISKTIDLIHLRVSIPKQGSTEAAIGGVLQRKVPKETLAHFNNTFFTEHGRLLLAVVAFSNV